MVRKPGKAEGKGRKSPDQDKGELVLGKRNYAVLSLGVLLICLGFVRLGQGSITDAPILLVLGYCVAIPIALVLKPR
ncbi:MAG: hypothetical protein KAW17_11330 [Candidatus Eisenbacteria sp.]|nr:hypothetical protein [Candidatus Eisenbacteria bacterium]